MQAIAAPPREADVRASSRDLILTCNLSPGDIVMMTAAVRDLHREHPGRFRTDVRTTAAAIWSHNPYITPLRDDAPGVEKLEMRYDLIQQSNEGPHHFIHGYVKHLEEELGVRIPVTKFRGDIHLSEQEKGWINQVAEEGIGWNQDFWIIVAGGKYDYTAKWWDPSRYQAVVDHFAGRIKFVQCGEANHWHPRLNGVIDLVGKTDLRQFIRLMYHASGVVCPVTFAMHLAAAVEVKPGRPLNRACVVIAGGREPSQWEKYGHHRFLETNGALRCCDNGGCWKPRCQPVGDGDDKDRPENLCFYPVEVASSLVIPRCMDMITEKDVIRAIEMYHDGGALTYLPPGLNGAANGHVPTDRALPRRIPTPRLGSGVAFVSVSDYSYFPGTLATVNSIFHHHPDANVLVIDNHLRPLNDAQRTLLSEGGATVIDARRFARDGRHIGPWELKAHAVCDLAPNYEVVVGIDSDCVLCAEVNDVVEIARRTGKFVGGRDGDGVNYDASYACYGIEPGQINSNYMSASLYCFASTPRNLATLREWSRCSNEAMYNGRGKYPGHGDQGILNSLLFAERNGEGVEMLDNALWSQHGTYWYDLIVYESGRLLNRSRQNRRQRALHCGGTHKFWKREHRDVVVHHESALALNYAWWLSLLWLGRCRDWSIDPARYLPEETLHLCDDLVNFHGLIRRFREGWTLASPDARGLMGRLLTGIRGCMSLDGGLPDYIELVRGLPEGARIVEVGACEGRSISAVAMACLDRDYTFSTVESFTGDENGSFDGESLPMIGRWTTGVRERFPFLGVNLVLGKSEHASQRFAPGSLDAVFIDAAHSEEAVRRDLACWRPRIKKGGILCGDDWNWPSVQKGVHAHFEPERVHVSRSGVVWSVRV